MSADYKPGTLAVATVRGVPNVRVFRNPGGWWSVAERGPLSETIAHDRYVTDVHPLVVLDPDDAAFVVGRLRYFADLAGECGSLRGRARGLADQIGAQSRPPKPPEPQGLGAVVEDTAGLRWTKVGERTNCWVPDGLGLDGRLYAEIDVADVLSEGVQP